MVIETDQKVPPVVRQLIGELQGVDMQVDSLAKLEFVPGAISALKVLRGLDFELVMATNQDGLGTDSFPEEDFRIPQEKMLRTLAGEKSDRSHVVL